MAGHDELGNFVRKFVSLWQSGCNAKLNVEAEAGNAFVSIRVGLGQAQPLPCGSHGGGRRGGSPAKQRRRERREAERQVKAATEQAAAEENENLERSTAEQVDTGKEEDTVAEEDNKIPQIDGSSDDSEAKKREIAYELKIDAHENCKNYDVIEAIEENYQGTLNDLKVDEHDPSRYILVQKLKEAHVEVNDEKRLKLIYRVLVNDDEVAKTLIESWKDPYKFDDLAFRRAVYDKIQIRIQEVQKI